jgi:nuclear GTP-binding protein
VENLKNPEQHIPQLLARVRDVYLQRTYDVRDWDGYEDFLGKLAHKSGRLLKGGEPDIGTVARMVLNDWVRGKIPYFTMPPDSEGKTAKANGADNGDKLDNRMKENEEELKEKENEEKEETGFVEKESGSAFNEYGDDPDFVSTDEDEEEDSVAENSSKKVKITTSEQSDAKRTKKGKRKRKSMQSRL